MNMLVFEEEDAIFENPLYINCSGGVTKATWAVTPLYDVGRNTIITTSNFTLVGKPQPMARQKLKEPARIGQKWIKVAETKHYKSGGTLVITTTDKHFNHHDEAVIVSVFGKNSTVELDRALKHFHYGAETALKVEYGVIDMRAEVLYMTRNV